ncbi:MAG: DUF4282 domain-containing protein [Planctomycetaceae bacterium]|nr:DUF4282 domain-containing protein [Planctomycetaceae bacterium]
MDWYYYDVFEQKQGPIDSSELKRLVTIGTITAETEIETEDGKKSVAGKVKGLKFSNAPAPPTPEDNTYNLNDLYSVASDNTVPVPPLTIPSQENQSINYPLPSSSTTTSYSNSQLTRRVQQLEEESSIWDYIFLNPKFTVFVTSIFISLLWKLCVIIFAVSILFSVFMIGNGFRILSTMPNQFDLGKNTIFEGFGVLIIAPFCLLWIRLSFELIFVFFRIENHLKQIEEKT